MSEVLITSGREVLEWLQRRLRDTQRLSIATGFLSEAGVGELMALIRPQLRPGGMVCRLLYGHLAEGAAKLHAIQQLRRLDRDHAGNLWVRVARQPRGALFHPRLFVLEREGGRISTMMGSSDLTASGLGRNVELNLGYDHLPGQGEPLIELFETWWYRSELLQPQGVDSPSGEPILARLVRAAERGVIASWEVRWGGLTLKLSDRILGEVAPSELHEGPLHYETESSLAIHLAPDDARRRLQSLDAWGGRRLGALSLKSSWGRLVTESCLPHLKAALPDFAERILAAGGPIRDALAVASAAGSEEFEGLLRADLTKLFQRLRPGESLPEPLLVGAEIRRAVQERERRLQRGPPPWGARLRLTPVRLPRGPRLGPPGLERALGRSADEDLRQLVITAASAPRRSLIKHRDPERALQLCLLPDPHLQEAALAHGWQGARLVFGGQGELFRDRTPELRDKLRDQVEAIHSWYDLGLDDALDAYDALLRGEEPRMVE